MAKKPEEMTPVELQKFVQIDDLRAAEMGKSTWWGLALEDALSDLVAVHGIGYLDKFKERRLRRTLKSAEWMKSVTPADLHGQLESGQGFKTAAIMDEAGRDAFNELIERVRKDPKQVT